MGKAKMGGNDTAVHQTNQQRQFRPGSTGDQ